MQRRTGSQGRLALALALASGSMWVLGGCQRDASLPTAAVALPSPATERVAPAYTLPTAEQLYQLVAPIALFPDKLLAQTLAASVYPDQVLTAQAWLRSNRSVNAADRAQATVSQSWDPSIKALTAFPDVVDQLAGNLDWTRALGDAYAHDPNDVLNAVQIMRQRAQASGHLRSTPQQHVQVARHVVVTPILDDDRIPPLSQVITIEPARPDVVYVPRYDPGVVYGTPVDVYRAYRYRPVRWYDQGDLVATGAVSFGVGVLVGSALEHRHGWSGWAAPAPAWHHWGWNSWGVDWNAPPAAPHYVVYQNHVYAPRTTIINNRNTYIDARSTVRQDQHGWSNPAAAPATAIGLAPTGLPVARVAAALAGAASAQAFRTAHGPGATTPSPAQLGHSADFAHLSVPHFNAQMLQPGRPVAVHASPSLASLPAPARSTMALQAPAAIHDPRGQMPTVAMASHPNAPAVAQHLAQMRMAELRPSPRGPVERLTAINPPMAAMPARDRFASRDAHNTQLHAPAQPSLPKSTFNERQWTPPRQQTTFVAPPRIERPQQWPSAPRQVARPAMKAEPQQHTQRMASFAPPRAAPARPAEPHPPRPHASQPPQHHDHHHDG